jgi:hypothetical protein
LPHIVVSGAELKLLVLVLGVQIWQGAPVADCPVV